MTKTYKMDKQLDKNLLKVATLKKLLKYGLFSIKDKFTKKFNE
jgi:hypothetical protein